MKVTSKQEAWNKVNEIFPLITPRTSTAATGPVIPSIGAPPRATTVITSVTWVTGWR